MALTDTFIKQVKHTGKPAGDKHTDGGGMYLLVKAGGKYWRMDYTHADKRKTLALGVYSAVSLAGARQGRDNARKLLAQGLDPSTAKKADKQAKADAAANTFEMVARDWLAKTAADRMPTTQDKITSWLEKDVIPFIGKMPMSTPSGRVMCWRLCARWKPGAHWTACSASNRYAGRCSGTPSPPAAPSGT